VKDNSAVPDFILMRAGCAFWYLTVHMLTRTV
jgi:hypothetical protein